MSTTENIPAAALDQHTAILGKTGSGKTSTAKLAVEQVVRSKGRVCILDPIKSDWWGLTSSADGKQPGFPFCILGGPRGHVALPSSAGAAVGDLVATGALPLSIIDMADFEPGGLQRFFVDFAGALLRHMRGVVYLVVEEAHEFAPKERSGIGAENMAIHWAKKLATAGRSKGIRLILATQRTQSLHNALLGSCETMIVHRTTAPADQKPVLDWLKANAPKDVTAQVDRSLASLKTGAGWLCSGEAGIFEQRQFPRISTYDNSATPTADSGEHKVTTAPVNIGELQKLLAVAVPERSATKTELAQPKDDPRTGELEARVRELEQELADSHKAPDHRAFREAVDHHRRRFNQVIAEARDISDSLEMLIVTDPRPQSDSQPVTRTLPQPPAPAKTPAVKTAPVDGKFQPSTKQQQILDSLAWLASIGNREPSAIQVGALALIDASGGHFSNVVGPLSSAELVQRGNGKLSLTEAGRKLAKRPQQPVTLAHYHAILKDRVRRARSASGKTVAILDVVIGAKGKSLTVQQIGDAVGIDASGGHFSNTIGPLSTIGLIQRSSGVVRPTEILFPKGL